MRLQDYFQYDSFITGINNTYYIDYKSNFHINAPFIIAANKTISTGNTYVLMYPNKKRNCIVHQVRLQDAYYSEGIINLVLRDIFSQETFTIDQQMKCTRDHLKWVLIDFDNFIDKMNTNIIKSYCKKCADTKNKTIADSNPKQSLVDDLLEFDL